MFQMRTAAWAAAAAIVLATAPATAQETQPTEPPTSPQLTAEPDFEQVRAALIDRQVDTMLSGIEDVATREQWIALGDDAIPALAGILANTQEKVIKRGRAAIALSHFPTPESSTALRAALSEETTPKHLLRKLIVALARVDGDRALDALTPHLSHASKQVREDAIKAIGGIATQPAQDALRARVSGEKSTHLKSLIATEIARPVRPPAILVEGISDGVVR